MAPSSGYVLHICILYLLNIKNNAEKHKFTANTKKTVMDDSVSITVIWLHNVTIRALSHYRVEGFSVMGESLPDRIDSISVEVADIEPL